MTPDLIFIAPHHKLLQAHLQRVDDRLSEAQQRDLVAFQFLRFLHRSARLGGCTRIALETQPQLLQGWFHAWSLLVGVPARLLKEDLGAHITAALQHQLGKP